MGEERDDRRCTICGLPASVKVRAGAGDSSPVYRYYCATCADKRWAGDNIGQVSLGGGMILLGVVLGFLAMTADFLGLSGEIGFGWYQRLGVLAGLGLVAIGGVFRVGLFGVLGMFLLAVALLGDLIDLGRSPGLGWRQTTTLILAACLLTAGFVLRRRKHGRQDSSLTRPMEDHDDGK